VFQTEDRWRALLWNGLEPEATLERVADELAAAVAALTPARQSAWEAYLQLLASLAADHWSFSLNSIQSIDNY
jgi:hypothetical protein